MANFYGMDNDDNGIPGYANSYGGNGNDLLYGDANANELYGGQGNDVLAGAVGAAVTGTGSASSPFRYIDLGPSQNDVLEGGSGSDFADGGDGDDKIYGGEGDDSGSFVGYAGFYYVGGLFGGTGNDELEGGAGDDTMDGGADNDQLSGGAGEDVLIGGLGKEAGLRGGAGADSFDFNAPNETGNSKTTADVVHDFSHAEGDKIDLSGMDINFDFIGKKEFHGGGDPELRYKKGKLQGDTDGDGDADFMIKLVGVKKLADADFDI